MKKYFTAALLGAVSLAIACSGGDSSENGELDGANQTTDGLSLDDCPAVPEGVMAAKCITTGDDVTAFRALEAGVCGFDMSEAGFPGCAQLDQAGEVTDECPDVSFGPDFSYEGCCSEAGVCGAMETLMGLGCTRSPDPSMHIACGG